MNPEDPQTQKILGAQLSALVRRLSEGKPLTAAQLEFVQSTMERRAASRVPPDSQGDAEDAIAANYSELSRLLGVSRQVVAYHRTRQGSPQSLSVAAWRDYLLANGKNVRDQLSPIPRRQDDGALHFGDGVGALLARIGSSLRDIVKAACLDAGLPVTPAKLDSLTFATFMRLAAIADKLADMHGFESVFVAPEAEPGEEPGHWEPPAITAIARRISARRKPKGAE